MGTKKRDYKAENARRKQLKAERDAKALAETLAAPEGVPDDKKAKKAAYAREYYKKNKAKLLKRGKDYYKDHRDEQLAKSKQRAKQRYAADPEAHKARSKAYYEKNKKAIAARRKKAAA